MSAADQLARVPVAAIEFANTILTTDDSATATTPRDTSTTWMEIPGIDPEPACSTSVIVFRAAVADKSG